MIAHALLLLAEAALVASLMLALFGLRRRLGLAPVYVVLGAFQYLQIVLATAIQMEVLPGLVVDPASVALYPITTFVVVLTYIALDAEETRKVAYGVVISNLAVYGVAALAGWHLVIDGHQNLLALPPALFTQSLGVALTRTAALFLDVVSAIVVFEVVSRRLHSMFLRLWVTASVVMLIDSVLLTVGLRLGDPNLWRTFASGLAAKLAGATFYAFALAVYLRYVDKHGVETIGERSNRDVFHRLTYRQRYEKVRREMSRDALTGLYNRGYFDEQAARHLAHVQRANHVMSLVLIDVDDLKVTNDRDGHRSGDELLRFVADQLQGMVRAADARLPLRRRRVRGAADHRRRRGRGDLRRAADRADRRPLARADAGATLGAREADRRRGRLPRRRPHRGGSAAHRRHPALPRQAPGWRPGRHRHTPRWRVRVVRLDQSDLGDSGCDHSGRVDDLSA